jgi:uncharacterized protein
MLTSDLIRPRLQQTGKALTVEMLDEQSPFWQQTATDLTALFQRHRGSSLTAWDQVLETYLGDRIDYPVVRGLAKVLTDAATFTPLPTLMPPALLRERLFAHGPVSSLPDIFHPDSRRDIVQRTATETGLSEEQLETALFADRAANALLTDVGPAWTPRDLLARYNLELARGVLYWASHLRIEMAGNYKDLWKYLKLFKLMFWAQPTEEGYRLDLDGPISPFVQATTRYGRAFAAFLPALMLSDRWQFLAQVRPPQAFQQLTYQLDSTCSLHSHFKRSGPFDSRLEADFAREFEEKFGGERGHWRLSRESEVLLLGDTVMIPDFLLEDKDDPGRRVLLELVGFWHPNYLRRKVEKVQAANCRHLLLLVSDGLNLSATAFEGAASEVIFFRGKPVLKDVLATVEQLAERIYGPPVPRTRIQSKRRSSKRKGSFAEMEDERQLLSVLNFSWLIENQLAGVSYPRSEDAITLLEKQGVKSLLSLTEEPIPADLLARHEFRIEHLPVADFTAPTLNQVERAIAIIDGFLAQGLPVAVHCGAGLGRTGTILACYLVSQGSSAKDAIELVRTKRPGSIEMPEQEAVISAYERHRKQHG